MQSLSAFQLKGWKNLHPFESDEESASDLSSTTFFHDVN